MQNETNEPIELNEFGMAVWKHRHNKALFAERPHGWQDRIIIIDESDGGRRWIDSKPFSTFDFSEWIPMTLEEYRRVKACYKEIYV
jgi:hypothetical protein